LDGCEDADGDDRRSILSRSGGVAQVGEDRQRPGGGRQRPDGGRPRPDGGRPRPNGGRLRSPGV